MDYAACNVVYVDRAAKEDRLVKREDVISATSSVNTPDRVDGAPDSGATLDSNLHTLLKTFSEGRSRMLSPCALLTIFSPRLHIWEILRVEALRIEPSIDR